MAHARSSADPSRGGTLASFFSVLLYQLLGSAGLPTFYDKLLQVPILNLSIKALDRMARSPILRTLDPSALGRSLAPRQRNLAYMATWAIVFAVMSAAQGVGDAHRGQFLPFWQQACAEDRPYACFNLENMQATYCNRGSAWACNELGVSLAEDERDFANAAAAFQAGCERGLSASCTNARTILAGARSFERPPPALADYPIILQGTKGPISDRSPAALYARACDQGWPDTCGPAPYVTGR